MSNIAMRISTITATAKLDDAVDLDYLRKWQMENETNDSELRVKTDVRFGNQVTIVSSTDRVSVKVFRNGSIQMTGLKDVGFVEEKAAQVARFVSKVYAHEIRAIEPKVVMINSDISLGLQIRREHFCEYLKKNHRDLVFSYEPCIYQGVILKFMYNEEPEFARDGVCMCSKDAKCNGKMRGCGEGKCRKISIIVFHSGNVIITGAVEMHQLTIAKDFIVNVVSKWKGLLIE